MKLFPKIVLFFSIHMTIKNQTSEKNNLLKKKQFFKDPPVLHNSGCMMLFAKLAAFQTKGPRRINLIGRKYLITADIFPA